MDVFNPAVPVGKEGGSDGGPAPLAGCFTIQKVENSKFASDSKIGSGNLVYEPTLKGPAGRWLVKDLGEGVYGFSNQRTRWWLSAKDETEERMRGDGERWRLETADETAAAVEAAAQALLVLREKAAEGKASVVRALAQLEASTRASEQKVIVNLLHGDRYSLAETPSA
mmetsp:Transcript_54055/g.128472  ORF Transcript_54055/g.128472 Transcript_54055/m.128472 type:complete len:169 (-) Transcript_54055:26-532(-)